MAAAVRGGGLVRARARARPAATSRDGAPSPRALGSSRPAPAGRVAPADARLAGGVCGLRLAGTWGAPRPARRGPGSGGFLPPRQWLLLWNRDGASVGLRGRGKTGRRWRWFQHLSPCPLAKQVMFSFFFLGWKIENVYHYHEAASPPLGTRTTKNCKTKGSPRRN